ncbi:DUF1464 family protein [Candidatus Hecatella orcuttiae]|uniref:DUF1464 family protein n=1 Tax=Candidatus Hecatella orcuttiae TaxID=1935119 RepID=UPI002867C676|nr:DUF1464 family protein [Candidatus Hecatella orcuttiae]
MVRVAGIDPGTGSYDLCGLADGELILDESIPTEEVAGNPSLLLEALKAVEPLDLVVGPSGHGLPLIPLNQVGRREYALLALLRRDEWGLRPHLGLRKVLRELRKSRFRVMLIPGVKHLPTVPAFRKVNRIDLGTADKLCCVALAIVDQARRLGCGYAETSFILVELGGGFNAYLAVDGGKIVDGLGGTSGWLGFLSPGHLDGELAYLLEGFRKTLLSRGGAAHVAGLKQLSLQEFAEKLASGDGRCRLAWEAYLEGVEKGVSVMKVSLPRPREILLSGRVVRMDALWRDVQRRLASRGKLRKLGGFAKKAKEAAQGAALLADGLAGGTHRRLVECLKLREAAGTVVDHIYLEGFDTVRRSILG